MCALWVCVKGDYIVVNRGVSNFIDTKKIDIDFQGGK